MRNRHTEGSMTTRSQRLSAPSRYLVSTETQSVVYFGADRTAAMKSFRTPRQCMSRLWRNGALLATYLSAETDYEREMKWRRSNGLDVAAVFTRSGRGAAVAHLGKRPGEWKKRRAA
jgi:uncharacterized protein with WD repeat